MHGIVTINNIPDLNKKFRVGFLCFNKPSRVFRCRPKFENHCVSIICLKLFGLEPTVINALYMVIQCTSILHSLHLYN